MSITHEQACEIVYRTVQPTWTHGTFCIDDRMIAETDDYYLVVIGAREWLINGDDSFLTFGGRATVVYKQSGEIGRLMPFTVNDDPTLRRRENPNPRVLLQT
ncbi:hypothetical protein ACFXHA_12805 [Nocardia sp. NPDC059240]|uniref:hypothetical protein n=1 Tax=Nocardia sp. NPDC059240 TaxID=3346786 RepID=UPI0036B3833E